MTSTSRPVAYAGEPGAFAEDAAIVAFGADSARLPVGGFREVFEAVRDRRADAGVVPIENLVNGSVRETYDLLLEHELVIDAEVTVPVDLCLAALPGTTLADVERVYSHIQALGQAESFLRRGRWQLLTTYNTAGAGRFVLERQDRSAGAVLSRRAAEVLGLEVLAESIQDVPDNRTKFLVLARQAGEAPMPGRSGPGLTKPDVELDVPPLGNLTDEAIDRLAGPIADVIAAQLGAAAARPSRRRTTIAFGVRNEPGTLLAALQVFANRGINLSKLESRPSRGAAWEYVFWADLDADAADPACEAALGELGRVATMVRVFGSYARSD